MQFNTKFYIPTQNIFTIAKNSMYSEIIIYILYFFCNFFMVDRTYFNLKSTYNETVLNSINVNPVLTNLGNSILYRTCGRFRVFS